MEMADAWMLNSCKRRNLYREWIFRFSCWINRWLQIAELCKGLLHLVNLRPFHRLTIICAPVIVHEVDLLIAAKTDREAISVVHFLELERDRASDDVSRPEHLPLISSG